MKFLELCCGCPRTVDSRYPVINQVREYLRSTGNDFRIITDAEYLYQGAFESLKTKYPDIEFCSFTKKYRYVLNAALDSDVIFIMFPPQRAYPYDRKNAFYQMIQTISYHCEKPIVLFLFYEYRFKQQAWFYLNPNYASFLSYINSFFIDGDISFNNRIVHNIMKETLEKFPLEKAVRLDSIIETNNAVEKERMKRFIELGTQAKIKYREKRILEKEKQIKKQKQKLDKLRKTANNTSYIHYDLVYKRDCK